MSTGNALALAGVLISALGFTLTVTQLFRTASAVERTEQRLKVNELLYELPQLHRLEQDLDDVARAMDIDRTIRVLNEWRRQAATVIAHLHDDATSESLRTQLQTSVELAGKAKNALVSGKTNPLTVTAQVRAAVEIVCRELPEVAAQLRAQIGGDDKRGDA
jgi:hypothetical protein